MSNYCTLVEAFGTNLITSEGTAKKVNCNKNKTSFTENFHNLELNTKKKKKKKNNKNNKNENFSLYEGGE